MNAYKPYKQNLPRTSYISFSKLKTFEEGPEFIWSTYGQGRKREPTQAQIDGSRLDLLLTDPPGYKRSVVVSPFENFSTHEARRWRDETKAKTPGVFVVSEATAKADLELQDSVLSHPEVAEIMKKINYVNHGYAEHPEVGQLYFIPDLLTTDGFIGDFKKVESVDKSAFNNQMFYSDWHTQVCMYGDGDELITGRPNVENKFFVAFEYYFPYRTRVYTLRKDYETIGRHVWLSRARALKAMMDIDPACQNRDVWFRQGYEIQELQPEYKHVAYNEELKNLPLGG